jgi:cytochrome c556
MLRKVMKVSLAGLLGLAAVVLASGSAMTADDKVPTIKEIMKKGHAKTDGYIAKIREDAKAGKWDEAKEYAKTLAVFGEALGKNKPKKGGEESWKEQATKYQDSTKAALAAVEKKDAAAVNKALGSNNGAGCHTPHK